MKRYISASTKRLPWRVVLGWGPIWKADEFLVYAPTKEAAIAEIMKKIEDSQDYEDISAYPADQDFIDEYASFVDDEQEIGIHKTYLEHPEYFSWDDEIPWDKIDFEKTVHFVETGLRQVPRNW